MPVNRRFKSFPETLHMRKIIVLAVLAASLATAACNTVAGAGKDVSSVGHATTDTANDAAGH
jgi:predicted small secreted protein